MRKMPPQTNEEIIQQLNNRRPASVKDLENWGLNQFLHGKGRRMSEKEIFYWYWQHEQETYTE